jgi:hypothetical protein
MAMVYAAGGIPGPEKALLLAFTNFTDPHGYCWPGEDRLADMTGTSVRTVRRSRAKLIGMNLIKSVRRTDKATGDPITNLTRVNLPLIASMKRRDPVYDDNMIDRIVFDEAAGPDEEESEAAQTAPDLLTGQSVLRHRTDCPEVEDTLTYGAGQIGLQSVSGPSGEAISRPSVPDEAAAAKDGRTDGAQLPSQIGRNPGVDLLSAIGAEKPEFLLTGRTLRDQGLVVAGMLLEGWTPEHLRQVVAGRPLPGEIKTTVGAVVSSRLRQALTGPAPVSAQAAWEPFSKRDETPTPNAWTADTVVPHTRPGECEGQDRLCGRPAEPGTSLCWSCARETADF